MKFAHSLGYPHCDIMLADMTATQYVELQIFFNLEGSERQEREIEASDSNILRFFSRAEQIQQKMKEHGG